MSLHAIPRSVPVDALGLAVHAAVARIRAAVSSGRSCRHLGGAMISRIEEAVAFHGAGLLSKRQVERAIAEAENLAVALAPLSPA